MPSKVRDEKCPAAGCHRGILTAGYCEKHYRRMKKFGSLALPPKPTESERFWAKVNKSGDCWEWTGHVRKDGYGQFRRGDHVVNAHRVSYELAHGRIPDTLEIDHLCRNRSCVNPSPKHLEAVPKPVNILRGIGTAERITPARRTASTATRYRATTSTQIGFQSADASPAPGTTHGATKPDAPAHPRSRKREPMSENHAQIIQRDEAVAVVLYGKPRCVQCDATERKLKKHNIHFTKVDVTKDEIALDFIKALGYSAAPVVYVSAIEGDVHWTQFDVDMIERHITARPDAEAA